MTSKTESDYYSHLRARTPEILELVGPEKPSSYHAALAKLDELEARMVETGEERDKDAYFWFVNWMLLVAQLMLRIAHIEGEGREHEV